MPCLRGLVWVGSGESNNRQSTSWGDGVYKSTDGGKTWTNMGLKTSRFINRIVIDPRNNDIVLVAATGAGKTLAGFLPTIWELAEEPTEGLHTLYISPLNYNVFPFDIAKLAQPLAKCFDPGRIAGRGGPDQNSYPENSRRLLRLGFHSISKLQRDDQD